MTTWGVSSHLFVIHISLALSPLIANVKDLSDLDNCILICMALAWPETTPPLISGCRYITKCTDSLIQRLWNVPTVSFVCDIRMSLTADSQQEGLSSYLHFTALLPQVNGLSWAVKILINRSGMASHQKQEDSEWTQLDVDIVWSIMHFYHNFHIPGSV